MSLLQNAPNLNIKVYFYIYKIIYSLVVPNLPKITILIMLFNNFAIDCLMLYISLLTAKRKIKLWRLALAGIIGAVYALFSPLICFTGDIVIKIAVAFILCLIAAKILSLKKLLILFTVFLDNIFTSCPEFAKNYDIYYLYLNILSK